MQVTRQYSHSESTDFKEFSCFVVYAEYKFSFSYRVHKKTKEIYMNGSQVSGTFNMNLFAYELSRFSSFMKQYPCERLKVGKSESIGADACDEFSSLELFDCF